jgi:SsrA-binding protein
MAPAGTKLIASNRKARHQFSIFDVIETGIVLRGSEVKALREAHVQLGDGYGRIQRGELWLEGVHISPYSYATGFGSHVPDSPRKLLAHRQEIAKLAKRVHEEHLTLVPLSMYWKDGRVKVEMALAKGRTKGDKRQALAKADAEREMATQLRLARRGGAN